MDEPSASATPLDAIRRFWWLLILTTLIGAGIGVAYGLARDPVYTAEARLNVGRIDVATQTIPGFAFASQTLADTYSRAVISRRVVAPVSRATGVKAASVSDHLEATPVPESGVIRVLGEDDTSANAVRFANVGARALVEYVQRLNKSNPQTKEFLARYRNAVQDLVDAKEAAGQGGYSADIAEAKLKLEAAAALYSASQRGQAAPNTLQVLALATDSSDDRDSFTQRAAFAGAVGGLLVGVALALLFAPRRSKPH